MPPGNRPPAPRDRRDRLDAQGVMDPAPSAWGTRAPGALRRVGCCLRSNVGLWVLHRGPVTLLDGRWDEDLGRRIGLMCLHSERSSGSVRVRRCVVPELILAMEVLGDELAARGARGAMIPPPPVAPPCGR